MPKSRLTLEDIENIKKSKGILSASAVQRQYNIGWERLKKLWNGKDEEPVQKEELQREIERVTQVQTPQREIVVEDFFARLGQLEANMESQKTRWRNKQNYCTTYWIQWMLCQIQMLCQT